MVKFNTVADAGRFIWGSYTFGFRKNPPADEHVNFFRAVLAIANGDNKISSKEKSFAKASAMMNGISIKDFEEVATEMSALPVADITKEAVTQLQATDVLKVHGTRASIYYATLVAAQDGLDPAETEVIKNTAAALEIAPEEVSHLIDLAVRESNFMSEKAKVLFPSGSPYHVNPEMEFTLIEEACRGFWAHTTFGMTEVPPADLTSAMIRVALAVAIADGVLSTDEQNVAMAAAMVTGFSSKDYSEFVERLKSSDDQAKIAAELLNGVPKEYHLGALYYACYVAAVDGLDPRELASLEKVGAAAGMKTEDMSTLTSLAMKGKKLHDERVKAVFPFTGLPYHPTESK